MRCPFPPQMNLHVRAAERHAVGWALAHNLVLGGGAAGLALSFAR